MIKFTNFFWMKIKISTKTSMTFEFIRQFIRQLFLANVSEHFVFNFTPVESKNDHISDFWFLEAKFWPLSKDPTRLRWIQIGRFLALLMLGAFNFFCLKLALDHPNLLTHSLPSYDELLFLKGESHFEPIDSAFI